MKTTKEAMTKRGVPAERKKVIATDERSTAEVREVGLGSEIANL
jgi:hypothetical protein